MGVIEKMIDNYKNEMVNSEYFQRNSYETRHQLSSH